MTILGRSSQPKVILFGLDNYRDGSAAAACCCSCCCHNMTKRNKRKQGKTRRIESNRTEPNQTKRNRNNTGQQTNEKKSTQHKTNQIKPNKRKPSVMLMQSPYPNTSVAKNPKYFDLLSTRKLSASPGLGFLSCLAMKRQRTDNKEKINKNKTK